MFAITIEAPPTPNTLDPSELEEDIVKRQSVIKQHSIFMNLVRSSVGFIGVMVVLVATLIYAFRFTNIHLLISEARISAAVIGMAKSCSFTESSVSCDYEDVIAVEWEDSSYPPVFGNTDVTILSARLRPEEIAKESRTVAVESAKKGKEGTEESEAGPVKCAASKKSGKGGQKPQNYHTIVGNNNVTLYKVTNCTMDRREEADAFVGTIGLLSRLRDVKGIPTIVDLFEEDRAVYCAVAPPLLRRLDTVTFSDDESALNAIRSLLETIKEVHLKEIVLLNVTAKTVFMSGDAESAMPIVEPPSQPLLMDDLRTGLFTLPRGMILPKLRRSLEAGGQYHKSLDFYMALHVFHDLPKMSNEVKTKLAKCLELFAAAKSATGPTQYSTVKLSTIRGILGAPTQNGAIHYTTQKRYKLLSHRTPTLENQEDKEEEFELIDNNDCTAPVYDHVLDIFRRQPNSAMDNIAP